MSLSTSIPKTLASVAPLTIWSPLPTRTSGLGSRPPLRGLGNRRGNVLLHAEIFDGLQPGVLVSESIWPNSAFIEGIGINALTGADAALPAGGAAFHDSAVWLRPEMATTDRTKMENIDA